MSKRTDMCDPEQKNPGPDVIMTGIFQREMRQISGLR
jgi:hypothetical protein